MRLGMIVRADFGRGLANQTRSFYDNLNPDVTVVVDISRLDPANKWPQDFDAYPDAIRTTWGGHMAPFDNIEALDALNECDLVYSAETPYDPRVQNLVLHVNPELFPDYKAKHYWYPTMWRTNVLPPGDIVPTPIDDADIAFDVAGPGKALHIGGNRASADRNGSQIVHGVLLKAQWPWRIQSQSGHRLHPRAMSFVEPVGYVENRWDLYEGCAVSVLPRRYGGQSLQVNEAMARGLAVVMSDCEPNLQTWPIVPVPARKQGHVKTQGGVLPQYVAIGGQLVDTVKALMEDDELLERWQAKSLAWARDNAWSQWKPRILELLDAYAMGEAV